MPDDMDYRAARASALLDDELLAEVLTALEDEAMAAFKASGAAQDEERRWAWMMLKVVGRIKTDLGALVETPRLEARRMVRPVA